MPLTTLEELIQTGRYVEAGREFLQCLSNDDLAGKTSARLYYLGASVRHKMGDVYSALHLAELAETNAIAAGDGVLLGRIWFNLGEYCRLVSDYQRAIAYGEKFLDNLAMYPELVPFRGEACYNQALRLRQAGLVSQALRTYEEAASLLTPPANDHQRRIAIMAHQNWAWLCVEQGDFKTADRALAATEGLIAAGTPAPEALRMQQVVEAFRSFHQGRYSRVHELAEELLLGDPKPEHQFWAYWLLGMVCVTGRETERAAELWQRCGSLATELRDPRLMNRVTELMRRIAESRGRVS